jgi:hypothetical protein
MLLREYSMRWDVEYTDEFGDWWETLTAAERAREEGLSDG